MEPGMQNNLTLFGVLLAFLIIGVLGIVVMAQSQEQDKAAAELSITEYTVQEIKGKCFIKFKGQDGVYPVDCNEP